MVYLRSIFSVLSAPLLYGIICVPLLGLLYGQFPHLLNEDGGSRHVPLLMGTELIQLLMFFLCGYVTAMLAPSRTGLHLTLAIALMLVIGVSVQVSYWDAVPAWHHYVFFISIVIGMYCGARIRMKRAITNTTPTT